MELISAYADGELTELEKSDLESHLDACDHCSSLLGFYREVSISVSESNVPAPEALLGNVMERVLRADNITSIDEVMTKKRGAVRIMLTRYIPVAACLAVILLTLPYIRNMSRDSNSIQTGGGFAPMSAPFAQQDESYLAEESGFEDSDKEAPGGGRAAVRDSGSYSAGSATSPGFSTMPSSAPAPAPSVAPNVLPSDPNDSSLSGTAIPEPPSGSGQEPERDALPPGADQGTGAGETKTGITGVPHYFDDAYAWIIITGYLPEFLLSYDPVPIEDWGSWDTWYAIPRTVAMELIKETNPSYAMDVYFIDENIDIAFVFYTP